MYLIPADRLHDSPFMTREPTVSIRKQKAPVKKRKHRAEAVKIRKHHRMSSGLKCVKRWTKIWWRGEEDVWGRFGRFVKRMFGADLVEY